MMKIKTKSTHAAAAAAIKKELKAAFPQVTFAVRSSSYSGGNSVSISWNDGPPSAQVGEIVNKYQYGHFNGMEDIYEITNSRVDIPQTKYVQTQRELSEGIKLQAFEDIRKRYAHFDTISTLDESSNVLMDNWRCWTAREFIYRILYKMDLTNGYVAGK